MREKEFNVKLICIIVRLHTFDLKKNYIQIIVAADEVSINRYISRKITRTANAILLPIGLNEIHTFRSEMCYSLIVL